MECKRHLNMGFQKVEKIQSRYLKELKGKLPRRESARRNHHYARHCDILTAIDTRMNLLSMTFGKYIDADLCCFFPGKIIDEIFNVLRILKYANPPRTYEVLQELRDISSMAMEHFDDKIVPGLIHKHQDPFFTGSTPSGQFSSALIPSTSASSNAAVKSSTGGVFATFKLGIRNEMTLYKKKVSDMLQKHRIATKKVSYSYFYSEGFRY